MSGSNEGQISTARSADCCLQTPSYFFGVKKQLANFASIPIFALAVVMAVATAGDFASTAAAASWAFLRIAHAASSLLMDERTDAAVRCKCSIRAWMYVSSTQANVAAFFAREPAANLAPFIVQKSITIGMPAFIDSCILIVASAWPYWTISSWMAWRSLRGGGRSEGRRAGGWNHARTRGVSRHRASPVCPYNTHTHTHGSLGNRRASSS